MSATNAGGPRGLSADFALGATGCCLAAVSATFGIFMTVHGPVASLGKSKDFTVFAQLAPRDREVPKSAPTRPRTSVPQDLDMTQTASIPTRAATEEGEATIIPSVTLQNALADQAIVAIDGREQTVRVGDTVPGAGEVLAIVTGRKPMVRTSRGLIVSGQAD